MGAGCKEISETSFQGLRLFATSFRAFEIAWAIAESGHDRDPEQEDAGLRDVWMIVTHPRLRCFWRFNGVMPKSDDIGASLPFVITV